MKFRFIFILAVGALITALAPATLATHTLTNGYVVLNIAGTGNAFYDTDSPTGNPDFTNTVATISQGQSILLGGEVGTSPCCGDPQGADSAAILFSIDGGPFQTIALPSAGSNGSLDKWQQQNLSNMGEIGAGLSVGTHTLDVRFSAYDGSFPAPHSAYLPGISSSFSAQIEVTADPTSDGMEDASAAPYVDGWQTGDGANGITFDGWTLTGTSGNSADNGFFIGSSTNNAGGSGGIDTLRYAFPNDPNPAHVSWGLYANNGNTAVAYRSFAGVLSPGQEFELSMDNGNVDAGGYVGFVLRNGNVTTNKNAGQRFEFLFAGGESTYKYVDRDGVHDTGIGFTGNGLSIRVILTSPDTYVLRVFANPTTNFSGRLGGIAGAAIGSIALYNQNAGSGSSNDAFFNRLLLTTGAVPELRVASVELSAGTNALINAHGIPGALHELQGRDDLDTGSWTTLTNNIATVTGILQINDTFAPSQPKKFYRLKATY